MTDALSRRNPTQGATADFRAWTPDQDAAVLSRFGKDKAAEIGRDLGRSTESIYHRAARIGAESPRRRWTQADDAALTMLWYEVGVAAIAKRLKRTPIAIYWRAEKIGLQRGCPDGFEYVSTAAARTGFCLGTLWMILKWAEVASRPAMARVLGAKRHFHIVDACDVDDAVDRWLATETIEGAARRTGWSAERLIYALTTADVEVPARPGNRKHWRIPTATIDTLVAARAGRETINAAARRLGIPPGTLRGRVARAGVPRTRGRLWLVERATLERLARAA